MAKQPDHNAFSTLLGPERDHPDPRGSFQNLFEFQSPISRVPDPKLRHATSLRPYYDLEEESAGTFAWTKKPAEGLLRERNLSNESRREDSMLKRNFLTRRPTNEGPRKNSPTRPKTPPPPPMRSFQNDDSFIKDAVDLLQSEVPSEPEKPVDNSNNELNYTPSNVLDPSRQGEDTSQTPEFDQQKQPCPEIAKVDCLVHGKPLEVVCENVACQTEICLECALFGQHVVR